MRVRAQEFVVYAILWAGDLTDKTELEKGTVILKLTMSSILTKTISRWAMIVN